MFFWKHKKRNGKSTLLHGWTFVISRMPSWNQSTKSTEDESCSTQVHTAVFTEQGSSASQTTAAKVMDFIARPPRCAGQAADAVSAYTQVKMEGAPRLRNIPKSKCPDIFHDKWSKSWSHIEDPTVPVERNLYGHPLAGFFWEGTFEEVLLELGWEKMPNWECLFVRRKNQDYCCQYTWMTFKWL